MKKLYLILLILLIMFIPTTNAVAVYQLDQPIAELNGYTLREVFEDGNIHKDIPNVITSNPNMDISNIPNDKVYVNMNYELVSRQNYVGWYFSNNGMDNIVLYSNNFIVIKNEIINMTIINRDDILWLAEGVYEIKVNYSYLINLTSLGISHLTAEQMDKYYNLYLEAVRFEQENTQAGQDPGGYQNIFNSIINGVKTLMQEMGYVWQWLNAPLITSDMQNFSINIDWSWDLLGVIRQILNGAGILTLQILFIVPSLAFTFMGIPVQISVLSLLFSNLIFLLLGWIMVKSFLI